MQALVKEIEARFGLSHVHTRFVEERSFLLERDSDRATFSVVATAEPGKYSVQIERPHERAQLIGFDIWPLGDRLTDEEVFDAAGKFVRSSYPLDEPNAG